MVLCMSPIQVGAHSAVSSEQTHTIGSLLSRGIEGEREHYPTYNPYQYRDSNPQPLIYKPDSDH